jgi:prepilin-type N-terminal cleavage/methylation domain-containing protein
MEHSRTVGRKPRAAGFTLTEVLIAMGLSGIVLTAALAALSNNQRMWSATDNEMEGTGEAVRAVQLMVGGAYGNPGLRMAEWDATVPTPVITNVLGSPACINYRYGTNNYFFKLTETDEIRDSSSNVVCRHVESLNFIRETEKPGTIKIDLVVRRTGAPAADQFVRFVTWVACRNRTRSP